MEKVGAGILNIITESLYDKPIVVFREYVQNSADSFDKVVGVNADELSSTIWREGNDLFFLDNGAGIEKEQFNSKMIRIANSGKRKALNIGYKGIGRLSGISYCQKLLFINICSYKENVYQKYQIDCALHNDIKNSDEYNQMGFEGLMDKIGKYQPEINDTELKKIHNVLSNHNDMFKNRDTGFLVILNDIKPVLSSIIEAEQPLLDALGWLLPVKFKDELFKGKYKGLFEDMLTANNTKIVPAKAYNVSYNGHKIERLITNEMLRDYVCKTDFNNYAIGFHAFNRSKIAVIKDNPFSGIRIYIDNMLLCNENELLPILRENGFIKHTINELIQSVKGIGAMIYITDKVNISANARRTFIEVTDTDSLNFLRLLAEFVENIYSTRYALSKYTSGKNKFDISKDELTKLKKAANDALRILAKEQIVISDEDEEKPSFNDLTDLEKKQAVKKKITREINEKLRIYLSQTTSFDYDRAYEDFKTWLTSN